MRTYKLATAPRGLTDSEIKSFAIGSLFLILLTSWVFSVIYRTLNILENPPIPPLLKRGGIFILRCGNKPWGVVERKVFYGSFSKNTGFYVSGVLDQKDV